MLTGAGALPHPDLSGLDAEEPTGPEVMGERMERERQEWMAETYEQRLEQAGQLARAVLAGAERRGREGRSAAGAVPYCGSTSITESNIWLGWKSQ